MEGIECRFAMNQNYHSSRQKTRERLAIICSARRNSFVILFSSLFPRILRQIFFSFLRHNKWHSRESRSAPARQRSLVEPDLSSKSPIYLSMNMKNRFNLTTRISRAVKIRRVFAETAEKKVRAYRRKVAPDDKE